VWIVRGGGEPKPRVIPLARAIAITRSDACLLDSGILPILDRVTHGRRRLEALVYRPSRCRAGGPTVLRSTACNADLRLENPVHLPRGGRPPPCSLSALGNGKRLPRPTVDDYRSGVPFGPYPFPTAFLLEVLGWKRGCVALVDAAWRATSSGRCGDDQSWASFEVEDPPRGSFAMPPPSADDNHPRCDPSRRRRLIL